MNEVTTGQGCVSGGTQVGAVNPLLFVFPLARRVLG